MCQDPLLLNLVRIIPLYTWGFNLRTSHYLQAALQHLEMALMDLMWNNLNKF